MSDFDLLIDLQLIQQYVSGKRPFENDNYSKFTDLLEASSKKTEGYVKKRQSLIQNLSTAINNGNRESFEEFVNNKNTSYDDGKYYRMRYYITLALAQVNEQDLNDTCDDAEIMAFIKQFNEELTMSEGNKQSGGNGQEIATIILHILSNSVYVNAKINDLSACFQKVIAYMVSGKILEKLKETDEQGGLKIFSGLVDVGVDITESIKKVYNEYDSEKINEDIDNKVKNIINGFKNIDELFKELEDETQAVMIEERNKQIDELVEFVELMKKGVKGSQEYAENMEKAKEAQEKFDENLKNTIAEETKELDEKTNKLKKRKDALQKLAEAKRRLKEAVKEVETAQKNVKVETAQKDAEDAAAQEYNVSPAGGKRKTKKNKKKMTKSKKHFKKQSRKILKKLSKKKGKKH